MFKLSIQTSRKLLFPFMTFLKTHLVT